MCDFTKKKKIFRKFRHPFWLNCEWLIYTFLREFTALYLTKICVIFLFSVLACKSLRDLFIFCVLNVFVSPMKYSGVVSRWKYSVNIYWMNKNEYITIIF